MMGPRPQFPATPSGATPTSGGATSVDAISGADPATSKDGDIKRFSPPGLKITIGSLDRELTVSAQYNPRELSVDRMIPWQHRITPELDRLTLEYTGEESRKLQLELLFDGYEEDLSVQQEISKLETMSMANIPVDRRHFIVATYDPKKGKVVDRDVDIAPEGPTSDMSEEEKGLSIVAQSQHKQWRDAEEAQAAKEDKKHGVAKRPHLCVLTWGQWMPTERTFRCVIESVRTRYTMFAEDGTPLRATVTLTLIEAQNVASSSEADRRARAELERKYMTEQQQQQNWLLKQNMQINLNNAAQAKK